MYYIDTIEQTKNEETGKLNEYGKREKWDLPLEQVQAKFYKKLSDVSADLISIDPSKNHYYMDIRIVDTTGGVLQKDSVGKMQEVSEES
jgi:hypothetical protein